MLVKEAAARDMGQSVVASLGLDDAATFRPIRRRRFDRRPTRVDIGSCTNPEKRLKTAPGGQVFVAINGQ